ncbi:hypothetical protein B4U80_13514 [Leptotrombidium deliense]|uniref:Caspase family p20 domain-containing protein n=1 Tax=Leptotrombidium deliense TaxID=299467 RepID=A0A443S588_9ACAR|nr:hypothetical protein B4U80_13514 [Leptotrombidium deliense]
MNSKSSAALKKYSTTKHVQLNNLLVCNATQRGFGCYRDCDYRIYFLVKIIELLNLKRIEISDLLRELEISLKIYEASQISEIEKYNFAKHFYFESQTVASFKPELGQQMYLNQKVNLTAEDNSTNKGTCIIICHCCTDADKIYWDVDTEQIKEIGDFFKCKLYKVHELIDCSADELLRKFEMIVNRDCVGEAIFVFFISLGFRDNGIEYLEFNNESYLKKQKIVHFWGTLKCDIPKFIFLITNRCEATRNYSPISFRNSNERPLMNTFRAFIRECSSCTKNDQLRFSQMICSKILVFKDTDFVNVFSQAERYFSNNNCLSICSFTAGLHRKLFLNISSKFDVLKNSYPLRNKGRGICVLMNTLNYSTYRDLYSSLIDSKIFYDTFKSLGYYVLHLLNINNFDVALDEALTNINVSEIDVAVVILLCETLYSNYYESKIRMKSNLVSLDETINKCCRLRKVPTIVLSICRDPAVNKKNECISNECLDLRSPSVDEEKIRTWICGDSKRG